MMSWWSDLNSRHYCQGTESTLRDLRELWLPRLWELVEAPISTKLLVLSTGMSPFWMDWPSKAEAPNKINAPEPQGPAFQGTHNLTLAVDSHEGSVPLLPSSFSVLGFELRASLRLYHLSHTSAHCCLLGWHPCMKVTRMANLRGVMLLFLNHYQFFFPVRKYY
jgi:hypothetical protein